MNLTKENWTNLLNYYITCLQRESDSKLSFFESGLNEKFFTPLTNESIFSTKEGTTRIPIAGNSPFNNFIQRHKTSNINFFYGYPIFRAYKLSNKNGKYYSTISPLFYSEVKISIDKNNININVLESVPNVNESLLKDLDLSYDQIDSFTDLFSSSMVDEDVKGSLTSWLVNIINELTKMVNTKLFTPINLENFNRNFPNYSDKTNYVLNNSMIYASETQYYHSSIIRELEYLKHDNSFNKLKETALYPILSQQHENKSLSHQNLVLCAETNRSQMEAVQSALTNALTVVSGPPGTGKSQVVLNLISSLIAENQSGLLVSKTNAAVSIISDYFRNNFDYPVILRTGNKEMRTLAVEFLDDVVKGSYYESVTAEGVEKAKSAYNETYENVFKEDIALKEKFKLADEMADLSEEYQLIRDKVTDNDFNWIKNTPTQPETINNHLDQLSKFIILVNERIIESQRNLIVQVISYIFDFFAKTRRTDIIKDVGKFEISIGYKPFEDKEATLETLLSHLTSLKYALSFRYIYNKLEILKKKTEKLPSINDVVALFEKNEKEIIEKGRDYITKLRKQSISGMTHQEKQKFKDFVDAQKRMLNAVPGNIFVDLKRKEEELFPLIRKIFPIWGTTSPSARNSMFPLSAGIFDVLIIDEASQCDIASMIPLLYRAKRGCIIGDINQLAHIVTFNQNTDKAIANSNKISANDHFYLSYRDKSIYEIAERSLKTEVGISKLDEHYRSHPHIIRFSNDNFYGRHLKVYTNPSKLAFNPGDAAVIWKNVIGEVISPPNGSALNKIEAEEVWSQSFELMKFFFAQETYISIGIVTPLRAHVEYLKTLFVNKSRLLATEDKKIYEAYTNHSIPFYIDTAYGFQGNERDAILFSTVASPGIKPGTYNFINERRLLNVAITRARTKLFVVGNKQFCKDNGGYLGKLADYADGLQTKDQIRQDPKLQSPIEKLLYDKLLSIGLTPIPQYSELGFNLDFAILDNGKKVAIECNGLSTHKSMDGNIRRDDNIRKRKLKNAGWEVFIFWSWDILQNAEGCAKQVLNFIEQ